MNSFAECVKDAQDSIRINDKNVKSFLRLGVAQRRMSQLKQSFAALLKAKSLEPSNVNVGKELATTQKIIQNKRKEFKESLVRNSRMTVYES